MIARIFNGRNQHQIKNRFICLLSKEFSLTYGAIRSFINKDKTAEFVKQTINTLQERKEEEKGYDRTDSYTSLDISQTEYQKFKAECRIPFGLL